MKTIAIIKQRGRVKGTKAIRAKRITPSIENWAEVRSRLARANGEMETGYYDLTVEDETGQVLDSSIKIC